MLAYDTAHFATNELTFNTTQQLADQAASPVTNDTAHRFAHAYSFDATIHSADKTAD